ARAKAKTNPSSPHYARATRPSRQLQPRQIRPELPFRTCLYFGKELQQCQRGLPFIKTSTRGLGIGPSPSRFVMTTIPVVIDGLVRCWNTNDSPSSNVMPYFQA